MGFLDHSTNNIIVDAVLTAKGREKLANGTFNVQSYFFGDTEVDYSIITKYGEIVGKEKIEKNTPIFEAATAGSEFDSYLYSTISFPLGGLDSFPNDITIGVKLENDGSTDGPITVVPMSSDESIVVAPKSATESSTTTNGSNLSFTFERVSEGQVYISFKVEETGQIISKLITVSAQ
jgi:hypothetical protein